jgi:hypothetical protein
MVATQVALGHAQLGALNAAHASQTALAHAAPNSEIGHIAAFNSAINAVNSATTPAAHAQAITAAATALAQAANHSHSVTAATVNAVDAQLGVSVSASDAAAIASEAAAMQSK